ncbi:hypothetical protein [Actinoplanes sp. NBRC 103695]|uniref:hypothetical protein n=1 Tax=Actinoplanes sp. NBRC 103695 TaxID=3032202 RepID=UPI0024A46833|nr:hypothetical protein [Actinoplanes sp. NBRC 103695]GLY94191.1 hypothetical protein Acsp02_14470 [Actinoplanes sp. NBRC 103695]
MHPELEGRYRRLLAAYPVAYRREYEEEMVGVLMAGAEPGSRRPGLRERADLLGGAIRVRLRDRPSLRGSLRDDDWRRALRAIQIFGAIALLGGFVRRVMLIVLPGGPGLDEAIGTPFWFLHPAAWLVVTVAALIGLRRVTAVAAPAAAALEVVTVGSRYESSPSQMLLSAWLVIGVLVVAAASVALVPGGPARRPRGLALFATAVAMLVAGYILDGRVDQGSFIGGFEYGVNMDGQFIFRWAVLLYLPAAVLLLMAWWMQGGPVRRRMVALAMPVVAMAVLVSEGFAGYMFSSQQFNSPIYLAGVQWTILALTPLLAFALAAVALNRYERISYLVRAGLAAETTR